LQFHGEAFSLQIAAILLLPFSHSAAKGAEPTLFAAIAQDATPAGYYGPGGLFGLSGNVIQTPMAKFAYDDRAAKQLFDQLEELAGIRYPL
jgi:hypothetical protein